MAHFYASIKGRAGEATRMGSKKSGIQGHIRGWHIGCQARCWHDEETGLDKVTIYVTRGSSNESVCKCLGTFTEGEDF